jgi:hydroxymethylglutaryl-CoA lyase
MNLPKYATVCDVVLRDGLQNDEADLSLKQKLNIAGLLGNAGLPVVEIGSFVSTKAVPRMAETDEVAQNLKRIPDIHYRALVLNARGIKRAADCKIAEAAFTVSVSRSHQQKNANSTPEETMNTFQALAELANDLGVDLTLTLATAFGCPFEGEVSDASVLKMAKTAAASGVRQITLADTTGMADPALVYRRCIQSREALPDVSWGLHFHNTRNMGMANVIAGLLAGVTRFDASLGGLGGCPVARGATGNIATEDLVHMLSRMGVEPGVDEDALREAAEYLKRAVGHALSSAVGKAGRVQDLHPCEF